MALLTSSSSSSASALITKKSHQILTSLVQSNKAILSQKLLLLDILESKHKETCCATKDPNATTCAIQNFFFTTKCPIVHASIGQHYRHSMDHIELAALVAASSSNNFSNSIRPSQKLGEEGDNDDESIVTLRYDLRVRGGTLEKDVNETKKRIYSIMDTFDEILQFKTTNHTTDTTNTTKETIRKDQQVVNASFMLSSSSPKNDTQKDNDNDNDKGETILKSTIGRELGFCAHHAIHHMAMVKIIAVQTLGIKEDELPFDFGKAPSTVQFEQS